MTLEFTGEKVAKPLPKSIVRCLEILLCEVTRSRRFGVRSSFGMRRYREARVRHHPMSLDTMSSVGRAPRRRETLVEEESTQKVVD
jgi:hypothetical protein